MLQSRGIKLNSVGSGMDARLPTPTPGLHPFLLFEIQEAQNVLWFSSWAQTFTYTFPEEGAGGGESIGYDVTCFKIQVNLHPFLLLKVSQYPLKWLEMPSGAVGVGWTANPVCLWGRWTSRAGVPPWSRITDRSELTNFCPHFLVLQCGDWGLEVTHAGSRKWQSTEGKPGHFPRAAPCPGHTGFHKELWDFFFFLNILTVLGGKDKNFPLGTWDTYRQNLGSGSGADLELFWGQLILRSILFFERGEGQKENFFKIIFSDF